MVMKLFGLYIPQSQPKKKYEKNGTRDAGVAPRILNVCTRCGTQESSEYMISGNYDESGDLKKSYNCGRSLYSLNSATLVRKGVKTPSHGKSPLGGEGGYPLSVNFFPFDFWEPIVR